MYGAITDRPQRRVSDWHRLPMPKQIDYDVYNPGPDMIERGKRFGKWFRGAVAGSGLSIPEIAKKMEVARQSLYAYNSDCIAPDGKFRKPSERMVLRIAAATNANPAVGMRAMGYDPADRVPPVPGPLAALPESVQQALANAISLMQPEPTRQLAPDAVEVLDAYEGLPTVLRKQAHEYITELTRVASEGHSQRRDIFGKRSDIDERPPTIEPDDEDAG